MCINIDYAKYVIPYKLQFVEVKITNNDYENIYDFAHQIAEQKHEKHFKIDDDLVSKRFLTGLLGERAVELFCGIKVIDYVIGDAKYFNTPDIQDLNLGIKSAEWGKFPIIFKHNDYPQIITLVDHNKKIVYLCGYASTFMLNEFQSDTLILNTKLRERGTKTGYYNFKDLIPMILIREAIHDKSLYTT